MEDLFRRLAPILPRGDGFNQRALLGLLRLLARGEGRARRPFMDDMLHTFFKLGSSLGTGFPRASFSPAARRSSQQRGRPHSALRWGSSGSFGIMHVKIGIPPERGRIEANASE